MDLLKRAVVACILRHGDRIALLKRSQSVGSSPGRWHCVTGFVEAGVAPLEQAWAELREETGLTDADASLTAAPSPIRVERPEQGWVWVIHPFLFDTATPELRLNWEHVAYRWIDPSELVPATTDTVAWVATVWETLRDA